MIFFSIISTIHPIKTNILQWNTSKQGF